MNILGLLGKVLAAFVTDIWRAFVADRMEEEAREEAARTQVPIPEPGTVTKEDVAEEIAKPDDWGT